MERNCLRLAHHERKAEHIAHELGIKASTVNTHVFSARRKLGGVSRLSAADALRRYEAALDAAAPEAATRPRPVGDHRLVTAPDPPPHPLTRQTLPMGDAGRTGADPGHPADVRERPQAFVFDDERLLAPGGQDGSGGDGLRRVALLLAIAVLAALVVIAAPAVYDSAAQRIANSLERPHHR